MCCPESALPLWLIANENKIDSVCAQFTLEDSVNYDDYKIGVNIDGFKFFLNMPDRLITSVEENPLDGRIMDLNEKIQTLADRDKPSLMSMLSHILDMLEAYNRAKEDCHSEDNELECDDAEDPEGYSFPMLSYHTMSPGSLHWMVEQAASHCCQSQDALLKSFTITIKANEVCICIDLDKVLHSDSVAYGLGFCKEERLVLKLEFGIQVWRASCMSKRDFMPMVTCTRQLGDEVYPTAGYGQRTLVPALVEILTSFVSSNPPTVKTSQIPNLTLDSILKNNAAMYDGLVHAARMDNLIVGLVSFLGSQLNRLPGWCPLCLDSLPIEPMKLQVCSKDICLFTCQEQGVGACVLRELKTSTPVVQLELAFMAAAAHNKTNRDVVEPFPSFLFKNREIRCRNGWFGDSGSACDPGNKMVEVVDNVLGALPSIEDMANCNSEEDLEALLIKKSDVNIEQGVVPRLSYKLIQFCLFSNRMSMQQLSKNQELPLPGVAAQFVVIHDAPEREVKLAGRSFLAFHGSHCGNWYSILRNGIRSLSKTKYMSAGAVSGEGIYCSPYLAYSARYAGRAAGTGLFKEAFSCVAIVEVFDEWQESFKSNNCYVVPKSLEECVVVRYLLVLNGCQEGRGYPSATLFDTMLNNEMDVAKHYASLRRSAFRPRPTAKNVLPKKRSSTGDVSPPKRLATHVSGVTHPWIHLTPHASANNTTQSQPLQRQTQPQAAANNLNSLVQPQLVQLQPSAQTLGTQLPPLAQTLGTRQRQAQGAPAANNTYGMTMSQAQPPNMYGRTQSQIHAQGAPTGNVYPLQAQPHLYVNLML